MKSDTRIRLTGVVGLGAIAVWLTLSLGNAFYLALISLHWPTVVARITSSGISAGRSTVGNWWSPDVQYEYQLGGRAYHSANIRFLMPVFYNQEDARALQSAYPQDAQAKAAYDPRDPGRSVLEPGVPANLWWRAFVPFLFWGLTGYIFYEIKHPDRRRLLPSIREAAEDEESRRKAA
ncbi:MAG TPA: DUF3592 domain-containing protein [Bryocella sp.]|nr:DUF3592 domain-containing protein [Bryocella sp.]